MSSAQITVATPALLDCRGRRRSPVTIPGAGAGRIAPNRGRKFPPQPMSVADVQQLLRHCIPTSKHCPPHVIVAGERLRAAVIVMWRSGLRVQEMLDLEELDLDRGNKLITVRIGKGGRRRVVGMDEWAWQQLDRWLTIRSRLPLGPLFCGVQPDAAGRPWEQGDVRRALRQAARRAGIRQRVAPHQLRHTFAVEAWREGIDILTIQRQLGHSRLDITQAYLVGLGADDVITPVIDRPAPVVPLAA